MVAALPDSLSKLLTPHGMDLLSHPSGPFAAALATHDSTCRDWRPAAPVKLFLSLTDEQAPAVNSEHCREWFAANRVEVPLVDVGTLNHDGSIHLGANILGVQAVAAWFGTLR
jgi:hypothetical protein